MNTAILPATAEAVEATTCEPTTAREETDSTVELTPSSFSWFEVPETWADFERMIDEAEPPRGGWLSAEESRRIDDELYFDQAVMQKMRKGPTMGGGVAGPVRPPGSLLLAGATWPVAPATKEDRRHRGTRRPPPIVGPFLGQPDPAVLPTGLAAALPCYGLPAYRACALELCDRLTERFAERPAGWLPINCEEAKVRYGHPRLPDGRRPWVWSTVLRDLLRLKIIEPWSSATSNASYHPEVSSKSYRLTAAWRAVEGVEAVERTADEVLPEPVPRVPVREDGTQVTWAGSWFERNIHRVDLAFPAAVVSIRERYGIAEPEAFDLRSLLGVIETSIAPPELLAAIDEERDSDDKRDAQVIARKQAESRVRHLWAWRVLGKVNCSRDPAGYRFHSPVTRLARELRCHLSLDGEELVGIDAKNSQMVLLAAACLETKQTRDALDFQDVCAEGRFYEETYLVHHGKYPPDRKTRDRWKRTVMGAWLYAFQDCQANSSIGKSLYRRWPTVHAWMWRRKFGGTRDLPCEMQRRESALWIDQLGPLLESINCRAVPVHDSVYVPRSRRAEVLAILEGLYERAGLRARFSEG